jgi:hypothetical protein
MVINSRSSMSSSPSMKLWDRRCTSPSRRACSLELPSMLPCSTRRPKIVRHFSGWKKSRALILRYLRVLTMYILGRRRASNSRIYSASASPSMHALLRPFKVNTAYYPPIFISESSPDSPSVKIVRLDQSIILTETQSRFRPTRRR